MPYDRVCGAKTRGSGTPCGRPAGWGTDHVGYGRCKLHGGCVPSGRKAAQRQMAVDQVATYGLPREVDPHTALLEELHRTAGVVAWLGTKVSQLEEDDAHGPVGGSDHPRHEAHVWIRMYAEERGHLARVAKTCVDVGIEERRVRLAEQQGELLAQAIRNVLVDLGVADHPQAPTVVRRHLTAIAGAAT
jgi:hypothetical protein